MKFKPIKNVLWLILCFLFLMGACTIPVGNLSIIEDTPTQPNTKEEQPTSNPDDENLSPPSPTEGDSQPEETLPAVEPTQTLPNPELPTMIWSVDHIQEFSLADNDRQIVGESLLQHYDDITVLDTAGMDDNQFSPLIEKGYAYDESAIYIKPRSGFVASHDLKTGALLWEAASEGWIIGLGEETLFMYTDNNRIYGLDKHTGEERWKIIIDLLISDDEEINPFPYMFAYNGKQIIPVTYIYQTYSYSMRFLHFDERTGDAYLTEKNPTIDFSIGPILYRDGLMVGLSGDNIIGLNVIDGSITWLFGDNDSDTRINYIGEYDPELNALIVKCDNWFNGTDWLSGIDLSTGQSIWDSDQDLSQTTFVWPTIHIMDKTIYVEHTLDYEDTVIDVYEKSSGKKINTLQIDRSFQLIPTESGMIIYYTDLEIAQGINAETGEMYWENDEFSYDNWFYSYDDIAIINGADDITRGIDLITGKAVFESSDRLFDFMHTFLDKYNLVYGLRGGMLVLRNLKTQELKEIDLGEGWEYWYPCLLEIVDEHTWILAEEQIGIITP